jgi:hypothetical protein
MTKQITNHKLQITMITAMSGIWFLGFGIWNLGFEPLVPLTPCIPKGKPSHNAQVGWLPLGKKGQGWQVKHKILKS